MSNFLEAYRILEFSVILSSFYRLGKNIFDRLELKTFRKTFLDIIEIKLLNWPP